MTSSRNSITRSRWHKDSAINALILTDTGAKIAEGDPEAVKNDPRVIAAYLGNPEEDEVA